MSDSMSDEEEVETRPRQNTKVAKAVQWMKNSARDAISQEILIQVDCLSFEMRKSKEELIAQIILPNFRVAIDMLQSGKQLIQISST